MTPKKAIIISIVTVALLAGGVSAYLYMTGFFNPSQTEEAPQAVEKPDLTTGDGYKQVLKETTDEVAGLIENGDEESIKHAHKIIDAEIATAKESGNQGYVTESSLAKAALLIETNREQEALDTILFPLEKQHTDDTTFKYQVYSHISWAYKSLGNVQKSNEYLDKIPGQGWN